MTITSSIDAPGMTVTWRDGVRLVELSGDHDITTAARIRAAIRGDNTADENVVLSLEQVTFLDSAIVGVLFTSSRALVERGIRLVVHCSQTTPIRQVLQLVHLDDKVEIVGTLQEAIDHAVVHGAGPGA